MSRDESFVCACCGKRYSEEAWLALPRAAGGDEMVYTEFLMLEFRNCSCGTTFSRDVLPPCLRVP
jgi:hypothetical protein